jgi:hypothetical protein
MLKTVPFLLLSALGACHPESNPGAGSGVQVRSDAGVITPRPSAAPSTATRSGAIKKWDFESDTANAAPSGFSFGHTGGGRDGRWLVRSDSSAPRGPNVLVQVDADDTSSRFPIAVASEPSLRDVRVGVRCKMVAGKVDQACGLVARYADHDNYYVTRANALEGNVRLYTVRNGRRSEIASFSGTVTQNAWHDYRFELRGDHLEVFWDGTRVIDHRDSTFTAAGRVGMWTKADSVTYFDDFVVEPS